MTEREFLKLNGQYLDDTMGMDYIELLCCEAKVKEISCAKL